MKHTSCHQLALPLCACFALVFFISSCSPDTSRLDKTTDAQTTTQFVRAKSASAVTGKYQGTYGIALFGKLGQPADFAHFDYVNPQAPKGGTIRLAEFGSFDSLNAFIIRGNPAAGLARLYDTLLVSSANEPYSAYSLVAKKIVVSSMRVDFHLHPKARFSDGVPLTAHDVLFSFVTLTTKGNPLYKAYWQDVADVRVLDDHTVRFSFKKPNCELAYILGDLPILPKHYWQDKDFQATTLDKVIGSGPYVISKVNAGKSISYARNPNYWAKDLPVNVGRHNFDTIHIDYYRSEEVLVEAVRGGQIDFRRENSAKRWNTAYPTKDGEKQKLIQLVVNHKNPAGMQGFVFNVRKSFFSDRRVRKALSYAFDFEFVNKRFMYSAYSRTDSYFANSSLASQKLPSEAEKILLAPHKNSLQQEVFNKVYANPVSSGSGVFEHKQRALDLLTQAGWQLQNDVLVNAQGKPFRFTIMIVSKPMERIVKPFVLNLEQIGVEARIQLVETNHYIDRVQSFDFDMIAYVFPQSLSPGNEQRNYWSSAAADTKGSRNVIGIKNPTVDALVDAVVHAENKQQLTTAVRALDRVLLWSHYVIPHFYNKHYRIVYRPAQLQPPAVFPQYAFDLEAWWHAAHNQ